MNTDELSKHLDALINGGALGISVRERIKRDGPGFYVESLNLLLKELVKPLGDLSLYTLLIGSPCDPEHVNTPGQSRKVDFYLLGTFKGPLLIEALKIAQTRAEMLANPEEPLQ